MFVYPSTFEALSSGKVALDIYKAGEVTARSQEFYLALLNTQGGFMGLLAGPRVFGSGAAGDDIDALELVARQLIAIHEDEAGNFGNASIGPVSLAKIIQAIKSLNEELRMRRK